MLFEFAICVERYLGVLLPLGLFSFFIHNGLGRGFHSGFFFSFTFLLLACMLKIRARKREGGRRKGKAL